MSSPPPLSIVIPTHDTRALTLDCLGALARARSEGGPSAVEVILVDDGSRDGTAEAVAAAHPEVAVLRTPEPEGFTRAANRGLSSACGRLLLLLNSDTEIGGAALAALVDRFAVEPRLGIAGGALRYPDGAPQWSGGALPTLAWLFALASGLPALLARLPGYRRLRASSGTATLASAAGGTAGSMPGVPRRVDWVTGAAMAIRRETWEEVGPLDERFRFYAQDLDLCRRAGAAGWEVAVLPDVPVLHHHGATIRQQLGPAATGGQAGMQHAELLWTDLLRWAAKDRGERWARRAARALRLGGGLRLLGRRLAAGFVPPAERAAFAAESAAYSRARAAARQWAQGA